MMPMIRIAGFAAWRFINFFKYLLKPRYVFFSFRFMLFKRFFELFRPRGRTRCHSATPILQLTHARNRPDPSEICRVAWRHLQTN
jgi:hypothetical protein